MTDINKLLKVMRALRDPETGCPWDIEQDFGSIAPYTIEEAYEVADAIDRDDWNGLRDELGDLLLQVVFHAQMADEAGLFSFADVVAAITDKMQRRHPHVFAEDAIDSAAEQRAAWDEHKATEREQAGHTGVLDGVARALPALLRAQKIGKRAAQIGFDWPDSKGVRDKVDEELTELDEAMAGREQAAVTEEFGDLLFALTSLARHLGVDSEEALRAATDKFERRFRHLETDLAGQNGDWSGLSIDELEARWQRAKQRS